MSRQSGAVVFGALCIGVAAALPAQPAEEERGLAEVIVTAQKREQSLQDVPISVAALGEEQLTELGIRTLRDFAGNVPNLYVNNFNGRADTARLFIRGLGQNDVSLTQDPSVALYQDGVYIGTSMGAALESADIERIEVLRGPQGTLYGRNATSGAINLVSRKPSTEGFDGKVELTAGNYSAERISGMLNVPLGGQVALRVSALHAEREGWIENLGPGEDLHGQNRSAARAVLRWQPADRFTADYAFDFAKFRDSPPLTMAVAGRGNGIYPLGAPFTQPGLGLVLPAASVTFTNHPLSRERPDTVQTPRRIDANNSEVEGHALTFDWSVSDALTLRSISAYRDVNARTHSEHQSLASVNTVLAALPSFNVVAQLGGPFAVNDARDTLKFRSFSQELQAIGDLEFGGGGALAWVGGLYYYTDDGSFQQVSNTLGPRDLNLTEIGDDSYAVFADFTWTPAAMGERLHLTLGGRYSEDQRQAVRINENSFAFAAVGGFTAGNCARFAATFRALGQTCSPTGVIASSHFEKDFSNSSVSVIAAFDITPDVNVYAKYGTGFKSGGTSQRSANPTKFAEGFDPEEIVSYELGLKSTFLDRRLTFNAAVFQMEIDDYQASLQSGATAGDRDFYGLDDSEVRGVEAEFVAAITEELRLRASAGLLDTEFGVPFADVLLDTGAVQRQTFVEPFSYAPEETLTFGLDYDRPLAGDWSFGSYVSYNYQSEMHTSSNVSDDVIIGSRGLVDAGLSLTHGNIGDGELTLRLWGKNLADKEYAVTANASFGFVGAAESVEWGEPRTYGLTVDYRF